MDASGQDCILVFWSCVVIDSVELIQLKRVAYLHVSYAQVQHGKLWYVLGNYNNYNR